MLGKLGKIIGPKVYLTVIGVLLVSVLTMTYLWNTASTNLALAEDALKSAKITIAILKTARDAGDKARIALAKLKADLKKMEKSRGVEKEQITRTDKNAKRYFNSCTMPKRLYDSLYKDR